MFACICRRVTEADVYRAGLEGAVMSDELVTALGLDDSMCCGRCLLRIDEFVALARRGAAQGLLASQPAAERTISFSR